MSTGPLSERINLLTEEWSSDLPLKFLWAVDIYGVTADNINAINEKYEIRRPGREWVTPNSATLEYYTSRKIGFLLAQNVNFPTDAFNVSNSGPNNGGFLPGYVGGVRTGYGGENNLGITFLECLVVLAINWCPMAWTQTMLHKHCWAPLPRKKT